MSHFYRIISWLCFKLKYGVHVIFYIEYIFERFEIKFYPTHNKYYLLALAFFCHMTIQYQTTEKYSDIHGLDEDGHWFEDKQVTCVTAICVHTKTTWWVTRAHRLGGVPNKYWSSIGSLKLFLAEMWRTPRVWGKVKTFWRPTARSLDDQTAKWAHRSKPL